MHYLLLLGQRLRSQPIKAIVITSLQRLQTAELNDRFPVQQLLRLLKWRSRSVGIAENMLPPYVRGKRCSPSGWKRRRRWRREEAWMWDRNLCSNEASKAIKGGQRCKAVLIALLQWVGGVPNRHTVVSTKSKACKMPLHVRGCSFGTTRNKASTWEKLSGLSLSPAWRDRTQGGQLEVAQPVCIVPHCPKTSAGSPRREAELSRL